MIATWQPLFYNPDTSGKTGVVAVDTIAIDSEPQTGPYAPTYQDSAPNPWQPCAGCGQTDMTAPIPGQPQLPPTQQPFNPYMPSGNTPATGSPTVGSPATGTQALQSSGVKTSGCGCAESPPWWVWVGLALAVLAVLKGSN